MDLNRILCVGRTDMYGVNNSVPKQHFYPSVSSFNMDTLRSSVRTDRRESPRSPSRYANHSPSSSSRSILRDNSPTKHGGSPNGYRNVRFTDRHSSPESSGEFSRLHVNETTQTNGRHASNVDDKVVQVYATRNEYENNKRSIYPSLEVHYDHIPDEGFNTPPMSASTPRQPNDRSPSRNSTYSRMTCNDAKQQRELPRTPIYRDDEGYSNREDKRVYLNKGGGMGVRKEHKGRSSSRSPTRPASTSTQTPSVPSGQKIIQNMGRGYYPQNNFFKDPKGLDRNDGQKIIQNMDLGKFPIEKSIGVQTGDIDPVFTDTSVQTQTEEEDQGPKDVSVQTPIDEGSQTPTDVGVQTPISVEVQTPTDIGIQTSNDDEEEEEPFVDAFVQTLSDDDDEESQRDVSVQTPREVGVQTPRTVSIQTSDTSDEEEDTADIGIQTQSESENKQINQSLDVHTSVWSNIGRPDPYDSCDEDDSQHCSSFLSSSNERSRPIQTMSRPSYKDFDEYSSDEEVKLPPSLIKPFPKREPVNYFGKLKSTSSKSDSGPRFKTSGILTDHSAKDLLEKEYIPSLSLGASTSFSKGRDASTHKSTSTRYFQYENDTWNSGLSRSTTIGSQYPEVTTDIGTQFHSDYHLELQKQQDRINEIAEGLNFTPVESHSFDPGKLNNEKSLYSTDPRDIRESFNKNSFIKDVNLGPPPVEKDERYTKGYHNGVGPPPPRSRIVKKVNFNDYPSTVDTNQRKSNYIFFKRTMGGDRYETFDPQPRSSARKPQNVGSIPQRRSNYMSPPRPSYPRPSSAPPSSQLTPTLNHLRKHAIRKRLTDSSSSHQSKTNTTRSDSCERSDTFLSSTNPLPQPLTLPLSRAAPYRYPVVEPMDTGIFESSGNQPRHKSTLQDPSNLRPRSRSISPSPNAFKSRNGKETKSTKPPIPRGRPSTREDTTPVRKPKTEKETYIYPTPADNRKSRSRSTDTSSSVNKIITPSKRSERSRSRDQSTAMERNDTAPSIQRTVTQTSNGKSNNGKPKKDSSSPYFGNEAVQRIIEKANLKN